MVRGWAQLRKFIALGHGMIHGTSVYVGGDSIDEEVVLQIGVSNNKM